MKKSLVRLYDQLTVEERFRLFMEALARGDQIEIERLAMTTPKMARTFRGSKYGDFIDASRLIVARFAIYWMEISRLLTKQEQTINGLKLAQIFWEDGFELGVSVLDQPPKKRQAVKVTFHERIGFYQALQFEAEKDYLETTSLLKGLYQGFLQFCHEVQLTPENFLAWQPLLLVELKEVESILNNDVPADEAVTNNITVQFHEMWPR